MSVSNIQRWVDVAPHSRGFCVIGKGKSSHITRGNDESLCGKLMLDGSRYISPMDTLDYKPCRACWKIMERESAELEGAEAVAAAKAGGRKPVGTFPDGEVEAGDLDASDRAAVHALAVKAGLVSNTKKNTDKKTETTTVATSSTMTKATQNKVAKGIRADIKHLSSLITAGKTEDADTAIAEIRKDTNAITGPEAAALKATLRTEATQAVRDAKAAKKEADKAAKEAEKAAKEAAKAAPKAEVANLATTDLDTVKELPALYALGGKKIVEAARAKFAAGAEVAEILVKVRSNILDKDGDPDLGVKQQITRDGAGKLYDLVAQGLPEPGEDAEADVVRDSIDGVKTDARRAARTVTVEYVRSLDNEPDPKSKTYKEDREALDAERAKYHNALAMFPEGFQVRADDGRPVVDGTEYDGELRPIKWSERVFEYYEAKGKGIARTTRAEQYALERAEKKRRKAELDAAVEAGEISAAERDASLNAPADGKKTAGPDERLKNAFERQIAEAKKLEDEDAKAVRKDELISLLAQLRKELNSAL
ncbi:hypothetical protein ACIQ9Q_17235 [Streptomyces sp. NPDC094438]|uniref:hypothetical protein n=1 Tax=Streptomyces sp. NPDC094438 TaxID=3366061 RepID=UPI00382A7FA7